MDFESMLQVLKTVGALPAGCRLGHNSGNTLFVSRPGLLDSARRTLMGEGRLRTCTTIMGLLSAASERLTDMEHSRALDDGEDSVERQELQQRAAGLHDALKSCCRGMGNLQATYVMDSSVIAQLDVLTSKCSYLVGRALQLNRVLMRTTNGYGA